MSNKKWFFRNKKVNNQLASEFQIHPAIIKILADRGIETEQEINEYLHPDIKNVSDGS